jgi:hypothetical protein
MDFASLMKAELEAKKAKMQAVKSQAGKSWMKQSELKQAELEAKKRASTPTAQDGPAAKKAKQDESPALKPVDGKDGSKTDGTASTKTEVKISDATNVCLDLELLIYWPLVRSVYCLSVLIWVVCERGESSSLHSDDRWRFADRSWILCGNCGRGTNQ